MQNVERVHNPSKKDFIDNFLSQKKPCIITGSLENSLAIKLWNIEYFKSKIGHKFVRCRASQNGYFDNKKKHRVIKLNDFFDWILLEKNQKFLQFFNTKKHNEQYFVGSLDIPSYFPELAGDLQTPDYFEPSLLISNNLWLGNGNNRVNLHYDFHHNFNAQIIGKKHWVIYPPQQSALLYPHAWYSKYFWCSQVDIHAPDYTQFPQFKHAQPWEGTVAPGEMIFVPAGWWHSPIGKDFNVAVNFWWRMKLTEIINILLNKIRSLPESGWIYNRQ